MTKFDLQTRYVTVIAFKYGQDVFNYSQYAYGVGLCTEEVDPGIDLTSPRSCKTRLYCQERVKFHFVG